MIYDMGFAFIEGYSGRRSLLTEKVHAGITY